MKCPRAIAPPSPTGQLDPPPSPSLETDEHLVTVLSLAQGLGIDFLPLTVLQFLSGPDIARAGRTNRFLYRASLNEGLWQAARDALWKGKVCVSSEAKALPPRRAKEAYIQSLRDSTRTWLGQDELTTFSWWFRFKQQAGEAWTAQEGGLGCLYRPVHNDREPGGVTGVVFLKVSSAFLCMCQCPFHGVLQKYAAFLVVESGRGRAQEKEGRRCSCGPLLAYRYNRIHGNRIEITVIPAHARAFDFFRFNQHKASSPLPLWRVGAPGGFISCELMSLSSSSKNVESSPPVQTNTSRSATGKC